MAISDFKKLGTSPGYLAEITLVCVERGMGFTQSSDAINEAFYVRIEGAFAKALAVRCKERLLYWLPLQFVKSGMAYWKALHFLRDRRHSQWTQSHWYAWHALSRFVVRGRFLITVIAFSSRITSRLAARTWCGTVAASILIEKSFLRRTILAR